MTIDITQTVSVKLKVVSEVPKNVSQKELFTIKYTSNEPETYMFYNVCRKIVHYKKKYNKIVHYLYTMKEPILNAD